MQVQQPYVSTLDCFAKTEQNKLVYLQIVTPFDATKCYPRSSSQRRDLLCLFLLGNLYGLAHSMATAPTIRVFLNTLD